jgi:hypothetical protein
MQATTQSLGLHALVHSLRKAHTPLLARRLPPGAHRAADQLLLSPVLQCRQARVLPHRGRPCRKAMPARV